MAEPRRDLEPWAEKRLVIAGAPAPTVAEGVPFRLSADGDVFPEKAWRCS